MIVVFRLVVFVLLATSCGPSKVGPKTQPIPMRQETSSEAVEVARLDQARGLAISTSEPRASRIAARVFEEGGNIVDAAVAASMAISTIRQQSTGLGGGGFLLHYQRDQNKTIAWDMREQAPILADEAMFQKAVETASRTGPLAVGTPGLLAGLVALHQDKGRLPWKRLVEPSILLAREGVPVSAHMAKALKWVEGEIRENPEFQKIFFVEGELLQEGDLLVQTDLAESLKKISLDPLGYFYRGEFADRLDAFMKANRGILTRDDLINYEVKKREPLEADWRNYRVVTMPPPSSGGVHLLQILKAYEGLGESFRNSFQGFTFTGRPLGRMVAEIELFKRAYADRSKHLGDSDFYEVPVSKLLDPTYLLTWAARLRANGIIEPDQIKPANFEPLPEGDQTTHLSLADHKGNAISTTQTINTYFGSKLILPGTGIVLNNEMDDFATIPGKPNAFGLVGAKANKVEPRKRPLSSMTPTIVLTKDGDPRLVLGAPGGSRIITSVYFVLSRILREGWSEAKAVEACRFHHQWKPKEVLIEEACRDELLILETYYPLKFRGPFGEVQVVGKMGDRLLSVADPRGHGEPLIIQSESTQELSDDAKEE